MLTLAFIVLLAQAQNFVTLEVCYLDVKATPWETRPDPKGRELFIRADQVLLIKPMPAGAVGMECAKICAAHGCQYVIGSVRDIFRIIGAETDAAD